MTTTFKGPMHPDPEVHYLARIFSGACRQRHMIREEKKTEPYDLVWIFDQDMKAIAKAAAVTGHILNPDNNMLVSPPTNATEPAMPRFVIGRPMAHAAQNDLDLLGVWQVVAKQGPRVKLAPANEMKHHVPFGVALAT
jgi:hypothetical protein